MLIFLLILFLIILFYKKKDYFKNTDIIFIDKDELYSFLIQDNDNYYKTFNDNDFIVRNISNINEYHDMINRSVVNCSDDIKDKINNCIENIKKKFNDINYDYFDGQKFNKIIWKIGFVKGKLYEGGLPHTRNDNIILPIDYLQSLDNTELIRLLIHEKIHIYQKSYPDDIAKYLKKNNFTVSDTIIYNRRANPDMDNKIYKDKDNKLYYSQYNRNPKNIMDVTYYPINNSLYEHPFEKMAYNISNY